MIFQHGWEPVLIQGIIIDFEAILENQITALYGPNIKPTICTYINTCYFTNSNEKMSVVKILIKLASWLHFQFLIPRIARRPGIMDNRHPPPLPSHRQYMASTRKHPKAPLTGMLPFWPPNFLYKAVQSWIFKSRCHCLCWESPINDRCWSSSSDYKVVRESPKESLNDYRYSVNRQWHLLGGILDIH